MTDTPNLTPDEAPQDKEEERLLKKGKTVTPKAAAAQSGGGSGGPFRFHPIRTIIVLILIILLLLFLIFFFGLGSGGGKVLPGSPGSGRVDREELNEGPTPDAETTLPTVRCELSVSFLPSRSDPETAEELTCLLRWTDPATKDPKEQKIVAGNMTDFQFALEKSIRAWRSSLHSTTVRNEPVVAIRMAPFPGEGTFRRIEALALGIDDRINILRQEGN